MGMLDPSTFPRGPAGIIPPPTPYQIARGEADRLRRSIRQAKAFADSVNSTIARNADPHRFLRDEQTRLARAIRQAMAFVERVHAAPRSPSPHDLVARAGRGRGVDVKA